MKKTVTESIGNRRNVTLLGGRLLIKDGQLALGDIDPFHSGTQYLCLKAATDWENFTKILRSFYVSEGDADVFSNASFTYNLIYLPVLRCGDRLLALNNDCYDFITDEFFHSPPEWNSQWDSMVTSVTEGCIPQAERSVMHINLSYKEASYLAPRLGLELPEQPQVVLIPFHTGTISRGNTVYNVARMAVPNARLKYDFPLHEDSTINAIKLLMILLAVYGACAAVIIENFDQAKPLAESYLKWWDGITSFREVREILNDIIPILGWIVGFVIDIILYIVLAIIIFGVVPALALATPAIAAFILTMVAVAARNIYLMAKKYFSFNKAVRKSQQE